MENRTHLRRIAILGTRGYPSSYSGYETMVRHLVRDWVERGIEVTVYCRERPRRVRSWTVDGVRCRWTPGLESVSLSTLSFGLTSHLDAAFRDFDAVLTVNVANGYFLPLLRAARMPNALNTDGIEWERGKWGPLAKAVFLRGARLSARFADVLVADSKAIGRYWEENFGVGSEFIPYGGIVVDDPPDDRLADLGLEAGGYRLVVGRMVPENNIDLMLDAMLATGGVNVIAGAGQEGTPLKQRLDELNRAGKIRWLGHVSDQETMGQLYANCGLYLHGHSVGGTNPTLIQALGAGAPVLAFDSVYNREVIENPDQMYPRDAGALAALIERAEADPDLRAEWVRRGQATVAERYSWSDVSERYLKALALAVDRRAGTAVGIA